ncbi:MAG: signal peptidase II [Deltaproteobacteria bacterium]|nr:signal peptidase II [Deltaproteobacteria bacterium]
MVNLKASNVFYLVVFALLLFVDLWTKNFIDSRLALGDSVPVIEGFFNITLVYNYGFAFGTLTHASWLIKSILTLVIIAFLSFLGYWIYDKETYFWRRFSLVLILAGGIGNLIDRLVFGYVRDFFDFYLQEFHWPAFNFADIYISCGVVLFLILDWWSPKHSSKQESK